MADEELEPTDESATDSDGPSGRDLADPDLPEPDKDLADSIDADSDGVPDVQQQDEGFDAGEDNVSLTEATEAAAARRPSRATAPRRKTEATPKQRKHAVETEEKVGPATFIKQSAAELKKVVWPTGEQVRTYFIVVVVFVVIIIGIVTALDLGFGWLVLKVFGG